MLIDSSYFAAGARHVQNATLGQLPNADAAYANAAIEAYIADWQGPYLAAMLGEEAAAGVGAYLAGLDAGAEAERDAAYDAVCDALRQSFADYVFFKMLRESNSQATVTGLVRLKSPNEYVSPLRRQVSAWNRMVDRNREFERWAASDGCAVAGITVSPNMLAKINAYNL